MLFTSLGRGRRKTRFLFNSCSQGLYVHHKYARGVGYYVLISRQRSDGFARQERDGIVDASDDVMPGGILL